MQSFNLNLKNCEPIGIFTNKNMKTTKTKVDYFLTNMTEYNENVIDMQLGDHIGLNFHVDYRSSILCTFCENNLNNKKTMFRNLSPSNILSLQTHLENESFLSVYECLNDTNMSSVDHVYNEFLDTICYYIDFICPILTKNLCSLKKKTLVNRNLLQMGDDLRKLFWLTKYSPNPDDHLNYKRLKKNYEIKINKSKNLFYQKSFESKNVKEKQKYIWQK